MIRCHVRQVRSPAAESCIRDGPSRPSDAEGSARQEAVTYQRETELAASAEINKDFRVEAIAQTEFEEAAGWYETQREGLGFEFIAEIDRVLVRIAHEQTFPTAPIATVEGGVVRREFVERFPYVVCSSRRMTSTE
jgi:hypothetical protein